MSTPPKKPLAHRLKDRYFEEADHPYVHFVRKVREVLEPDHVLVEPGCGRFAEVIRKFQGEARELIGIDPVEFEEESLGTDVRIVRGTLDATGLDTGSVDTMISRALMEHIEHPDRVFAEIARVLKPGGTYVFLAPNLGDYTALAAKLIPNRMHPWIVEKLEGRNPKDTFPAYFRCNTKGSLKRLTRANGLELESVEYLGQYPSYFLFNAPLFLAGTAYEKLISSTELLGFLRGWMLVVIRKPRG